MADGDRQISPFCPRASGAQDSVPAAHPATPFGVEAPSLLHECGGVETDTSSEDGSSEASSDSAREGGVEAGISVVPSGCPIPNGLWRVLSTMGLLPAGQREAELVLYISAHSAFDACPPTQTHVSVPSPSGSPHAVRSGDREDHVEETTGGDSDSTTVLCSAGEVQERIEDRHVGDGVGGAVPGERGVDSIPDRVASVEVRPEIETHVAVQVAEEVLRRYHCVFCLEALDDRPPRLPGPYGNCYDLFQELFIHEVTWLTLPCCYQHMHTACAVQAFMGKNCWTCPYCKTVMVDDLYGPAGRVHLHGQASWYAKVLSLRAVLMDELPRVLGDEHLIPFLTMGTVKLAHPTA